MHLLTVSFIISNYVYSSDNPISCNDATTVFRMVLDFFKMAWKSMEMAWNFVLAQVYEPWRRMLRMELPGKRKRGRPKRRFMDVVKEDMALVAVMGGEDAEVRTEWRWKILCGDP